MLAPPEKGSVRTPGDTLLRLDSELYEAMLTNEISDVHEKCKKYLQFLRRYLFFKKNELSTCEASAVEKNEP